MIHSYLAPELAEAHRRELEHRAAVDRIARCLKDRNARPSLFSRIGDRLRRGPVAAQPETRPAATPLVAGCCGCPA